MPPARVDAIMQGDQRPKVEKLADNFSSGLLVPSDQLKHRWATRQPNQDIYDWIIAAAKDFRVSGEALYWRLINTGLLSKLERVDINRLSRSDEDDQNGRPNRYSAQFVRQLHSVLDRGLVSVRKAADLLECEPYDLTEIVSAYGFDPSF
jgi:Zn-dependent peptidase ImmA (M78 family)